MTTGTLTPGEVRTALEAAGRRCTRQRLRVYEVLARALHHPTAEDVFDAVRPTIPQISLATVYKALEALVASGLAAKLPASGDGSGSARYDARGDGHYHLRCTRSGRVEDLPTAFDPDLITRLDPDLGDNLRARGFHVTGYRLELLGHFGTEAEPAAPDGPADD